MSRKIGYMAIGTLLLSPLLLVGAISWIGFLWFANNTNETRHWILINNWLTRSVTICSLIIRTGGGMLSGVCTAMLAALALERGGVFLADAASVLIIRAAGSSSLLSSLLLKLLKTMFASFEGVVWLGAGLFLLITTTVIQFSSLILISDIQIAQIPGLVTTTVMPYGFNYSGFSLPPYPRLEMRVGAWYRKPPFYPAFAEYHEPPVEQDAISDTGLTLRAMIPFSSGTTRETIQYFSGNTTVLDTRVTCQRPRLDRMNITLPPNQYNSTITFTGQVWPTVQTPRLLNYTAQASMDSNEHLHQFNNIGYWFNCSAANNASHTRNELYKSDLLFVQWRTSLCQLGSWSGDAYAGGLLSEFLEYPRPPSEVQFDITCQTCPVRTYGNAYLILNVTSGFTQDWELIPGIFSGVTPMSSQDRGEWVDLQSENTTLSVTLCYTAFGSTEEPVTIIGNMNRTEPQPGYNYNMSLLTFEDIRQQLGQNPQTSSEARGILDLKNNGSWLSNNTEVGNLNYIEMFSDGASLVEFYQHGTTPNFTVVLYDWTTSITSTDSMAVPEKMHIHMFQEIVTSGGTMAFALQSVLTVLGTMSYYDQMLQFDMFGSTEQAFLIPTNVPSTQRGFAVLFVALVLHLMLAGFITLCFWLISSISSLDSDWQAIAQAASKDTKEILARASDPGISQKAISRFLKDTGNDRVRVQVGELATSDAGGTRYRRVGIRDMESSTLSART